VLKLSALRFGRLYPQEISLVLISVSRYFDLIAIVQLEGFDQRQIPMAPLGNEPTIHHYHHTDTLYHEAPFFQQYPT